VCGSLLTLSRHIFILGYNCYPIKTDKKEILRELLLSENRGYVLSIKVKDIPGELKNRSPHG
jgi:hypothetical protein